MLGRINKAAAAGLMVAVAVCMFLVAPPAARAERAWCGEEQDDSCNDYCVDRGDNYYCCLTSGGGGYSCTCYMDESECD
jgi:hypothetical protein